MEMFSSGYGMMLTTLAKEHTLRNPTTPHCRDTAQSLVVEAQRRRHCCPAAGETSPQKLSSRKALLGARLSTPPVASSSRPSVPCPVHRRGVVAQLACEALPGQQGAHCGDARKVSRAAEGDTRQKISLQYKSRRRVAQIALPVMSGISSSARRYRTRTMDHGVIVKFSLKGMIMCLK